MKSSGQGDVIKYLRCTFAVVTECSASGFHREQGGPEEGMWIQAVVLRCVRSLSCSCLPGGNYFFPLVLLLLRSLRFSGLGFSVRVCLPSKPTAVQAVQLMVQGECIAMVNILGMIFICDENKQGFLCFVPCIHSKNLKQRFSKFVSNSFNKNHRTNPTFMS